MSQPQEARRPRIRPKQCRKALPCGSSIAYEKAKQAAKIRHELQQLVFAEHPSPLHETVDSIPLRHGLGAFSGFPPATLHITPPQSAGQPLSSTTISAEGKLKEESSSAIASASIQSAETELTKDKDPLEDVEPPTRHYGPKRKHASHNLAELIKEVNADHP
jgi:hypothetical protein